MYAWAYRYITKYDGNVYHSEGHPTLQRIEKNKSAANANIVYRANRNKSGNVDSDAAKGKKRKLSREEVGDYCVEKGIKTLNELMSDAQRRKVEGDTTLSSFIYGGNSLKSVRETIDIAWMMQKSVSKVRNLSTPRLQQLRNAAATACVNNCNGGWIHYALDVLEKNNINKYVYAHAIRNLLEKGRGKRRNLLLIGRGNTAKTFLLNPLKEVYPEHFSNPAASSFSWIGADEASVIFLNNYIWYSKRDGGNIE